MIPIKVESTFVNVVKITELKDVDYIVQLHNSFSGKSWVFKIYKDLWDKSMEIRGVQNLDIIITSDNIVAKEKKEAEEKKSAKIYL